MPKKLTQKEIIERFHKRWRDRYDYSKVVYVNKRTPITITCKEHGDFQILPLEHAKGHGCSKCGNEAQAKKLSKPKKDKKWLLKRLYEIYGTDAFDFSAIEDVSFVYNGVKTPLPVVCKVCGTPSNAIASQRLKGSGCNACRLKKFSKVNLGKAKPISERELIAGVGINDVNGVVKHDKAYTIWREMIVRCYKGSYWEKRPTYKHCDVCDEWKRYSNYLQWYNANYIEGFDVDKDLLSFCTEKKIYSPETCCFLPPEINCALSTSKSIERDLPVGVHIISGCITSSLGNNHLGTFPTVEMAHKAYLNAKKEHIINLANKWKDKIEPRAYDALISLDVHKFFNNKKVNCYGTRNSKIREC